MDIRRMTWRELRREREKIEEEWEIYRSGINFRKIDLYKDITEEMYRRIKYNDRSGV